MILTKTPYRISFLGGATDYEPWYSKHGGAALSTTISSYCHIMVRRMPPFFESRFSVSWSQTEKVDDVDSIVHPGVRGCLEFLNITDGIDTNMVGDLPARSGLGSSSAFTVGMLNGLHALQGEYTGKSQLASEAVRVEQDVLNETVGIQDQIACSYGGLNRIDIDRGGSYRVNPIPLDPVRRHQFEERLLLVFTGRQRYASDIAKDQAENADPVDLTEIQGMVPKGVDILTGTGSLDEFGELLHEAWMVKKRLSAKITDMEIDNLYISAIDAGALGGKLLGAGGGGFMLLYVPPRARSEVAEAIGGLASMPVKFEQGGSQIVYYSP